MKRKKFLAPTPSFSVSLLVSSRRAVLFSRFSLGSFLISLLFSLPCVHPLVSVLPVSMSVSVSVTSHATFVHSDLSARLARGVNLAPLNELIPRSPELLIRVIADIRKHDADSYVTRNLSLPSVRSLIFVPRNRVCFLTNLWYKIRDTRLHGGTRTGGIIYCKRQCSSR